MKNLMFLLVFSALFFSSCDKNEDLKLFCPEVTKICDAISIDDKAIDKAIIEEVINKLTSDLTPAPTTADPIGQEAHLHTLIDRLNSCDCMEASFGCYACMESFPPQSSIGIVVKKGTVDISKGISIFTSETETLKFSAIN